MTATSAQVRTARPSSRLHRLRPELTKELMLAVGLVIVGTLLPAVLGLDFWAQMMLLIDLYLIATIGLNILMAEAGQIAPRPCIPHPADHRDRLSCEGLVDHG